MIIKSILPVQMMSPDRAMLWLSRAAPTGRNMAPAGHGKAEGRLLA
ncbi:unnamed protein product [Acidocella sp. C78]|nr:unnamed protein product [Acidocella sp. C78]